jgi:hypothetical protein
MNAKTNLSQPLDSSAVTTLPANQNNDWVQQWWLDQIDAGQVIQLEYPVKPGLRRELHKPIHRYLDDAFRSNIPQFAGELTRFCQYKTFLDKIPAESSSRDDGLPHWNNMWIPALDGISIYCYVASRQPKTYLEIGSGNSTRFARKAITDHKLSTRIISIDPCPRSDIDRLCDIVVRDPLEKTDLSIFADLEDNDIIFCDNSHRGFQNSDVTVFATEIIPEVSTKSILIGVHDIFLPYDYPEEWLRRYYNEQYFLFPYILARYLKVLLPNYYASVNTPLREIVAGIADVPGLTQHRPAAIWLECGSETSGYDSASAN